MNREMKATMMAMLVFSIIISLVLGFLVGNILVKPIYSVNSVNIAKPENKYFDGESASFLEGLKLDLPEEISTIKRESDSTYDLFEGYLDTNEGVIHLRFANFATLTESYRYVKENNRLGIKPIW